MPRTPLSTILAAPAVSLALCLGAPAARAGAGPAYSAGTPVLDTVTGTAANPAPWTLSQGDPTLAPYSPSLPTFPLGGPRVTTCTEGSITVSTPSLSVAPGSASTENRSGTFPYATGYA